MQRCLGLVCVYIFFDALGIGSLNTILRATGRMRVPGLINLLSFYVVGLPLSYYLTFMRSELELGLRGLCAAAAAPRSVRGTRPTRPRTARLPRRTTGWCAAAGG